MMFTHKVSKRLAVITPGLVLGMFLMGCATEKGATDPSTPPPPPSESHAGWHVAPSGSSSNAGSTSQPWSLDYALHGASGQIQPGDTVWLHGGTYRGAFRPSVAGAPGNPVVIRQYPGERATIDVAGARSEE